MKNRTRRVLEQKFVAIAMLLVCFFLILIAISGKTPEDRDVTPVLFLAPIGIYLLTSKEGM